MSVNVGAVDLDLALNSKDFEKKVQNVVSSNKKELGGMSSTFKQIGLAAVTAFSVKKLIDFGSECLKLGSDLSEVQNVVDVTFGNLNKNVDEFAKNAIDKFGLGQTVTKKYVGTFGAMAKAFNFSNDQALTMSESLTGLAGDVASFYNLSSDEAFTKLKSVFTGETESLKDLGVVMTQTALDQYALEKGFGKATAKMSEQEKTALRYQFVMDKLKLASGDFERTQDSWANQTRVLNLRFDEFKATLGQGFINLFTPIVKGINWVLSKLQVLADAFKSFTENIFGKASGGGGATSVISDVANSAGGASEAVGGIGESAKKAKKDLLGLRGIDELNNATTSDDSSGAGGSAISGIDTSSIDNSLKATTQNTNNLANSFNGLFDTLKKGFEIGLNGANFDGILKSIGGIGESLTEIFTDPSVQSAGQNWVNGFLLNLGKVTGSVGSVGISIADNLFGGIDLFLNQNKNNLKDHIVKLFDISSRSQEMLGNFAVALADVFTIFKSPQAKQITADILGIFTNGFLGVTEVVGTLGNDLMYILTQPFIDNKDLIKNYLEGLLAPISSVLSTIKNGVDDTFSKFWEVYNTYIAPAVEGIKNGFSSILETMLTVWYDNLQPILDEWAVMFSALWIEHIQPMVNGFLEFFGKLISGISELWQTWLVPMINWIIENVVPVLAPIIESIGAIIGSVFGAIMDTLKGLWDFLGGLIDFIVGVFTGDWDKAWGGIQSIFQGIWEMIKGVVTGVWSAITGIISTAINVVRGVISTVLNAIGAVWNNIWNGICNSAKNVWGNITGTISNALNTAKNTVTSILNSIKNVWDNIWNGLGNAVKNAFNGIWNGIRSVANSILGGIEHMVNGVIRGLNGLIRGVNKVSSLVGLNFGEIGTVSLPRLAQGGYFKANQPTLAMVGDNKTQDEIVSPVPKMQDALRAVLREQQAGGGSSTEVVMLLKELISVIKNSGGDTVLEIGDIEIARAVIRGLRALQGKSNKPVLEGLI